MHAFCLFSDVPPGDVRPSAPDTAPVVRRGERRGGRRPARRRPDAAQPGAGPVRRHHLQAVQAARRQGTALPQDRTQDRPGRKESR